MAKLTLTPETMTLIAERFKVLGEAARLHILNALRDGDVTVGELVERTGLSQANVSKHLQVLHTNGFVAREKDGLYVRYRLADKTVFSLCDIMCGRLESELQSRSKALGAARR